MVLVPALHKFTDVEEENLFPTSVAVVFPLCLVSLTVYGLHGDLPWQTAWPYLVGSGLGGVVAGMFGRRVLKYAADLFRDAGRRRLSHRLPG